LVAKTDGEGAALAITDRDIPVIQEILIPCASIILFQASLGNPDLVISFLEDSWSVRIRDLGVCHRAWGGIERIQGG
jgi:hypothetical protein